MKLSSFNSFSIIFLLILLFPSRNYNLNAYLVLVLLPFVRVISLTSIFLGISILILILINYNSFEIENFKYFLALIVSVSVSNRSGLIELIRLSAILVFFMLLAELAFTDLIRALYRSSNDAFHYARRSSLFLYPGDLGSFGAILISLELFMSKMKSRFDKNNLLYLIIGFIFILLSQSRMSIAQLVITISILVVYRPKLFVLLAFILAFILSSDFFELEYLMRQDFMTLLNSFNPLGEEYVGNKRAEEFVGIFINTSSGDAFYEGSIPGFVARFGIGGFLFFVIMYIFSKGLRKMTGMSSLVFAPLLLTSMIGAPFERPKLLLLSFAAICYVVNISKNEESFSSSVQK